MRKKGSRNQNPKQEWRKKELQEWILENVDKDISDSKIKRIKEKVDETVFLEVWKACLNNKAEEYTTGSEYQIAVIGECCDFYCQIWGNSEQIKKISVKCAQIESNIYDKKTPVKIMVLAWKRGNRYL